ncbi:NurA domain-containing protein [Candidatus Nitrososphaera gargensis Ga9.2]|uniref:NurA domain-containing protein n=1 Tax=Nitrososphaera gargensis (strain Ga9.2) TaxID=1237085 RepID=K0IMI9_NITGG|nr:hypothetical protein [Candidatus Nitrososphaera gargensis]AFU60327.1 NurA domain-containing protein [Candidatus Nitrososphaera gargensis Ga9.2]
MQKIDGWMDRDVVAAMNLSIRGRAFLAKSEDEFERPKGDAGEAMKGNPMTAPVILRVDASKLIFRHQPKNR